MAKKRVEEVVWELALPIVENNLFELVDVEFVKEGANWYLRVYIDKEGGITIDDCQLISEELSDKIDKVDPIKQSYFLEVSSPGLERPLKTTRDFEKSTGKKVELKLFKPLEGKKLFEGELVGLIDNKIVIRQNDMNIIEFEKEAVAIVKKIIEF